MPEETSGYMIALRGQGAQPFECDGRGCGALRLQHCYELIGTFKHTTDPRLLDGLLTLKVEKHKEIPDRTENCGWNSAAWSGKRTEEGEPG